MLARDLKMSCIMLQRRVILECFKDKMKESISGDSTMIYIGQIFRENILYFESEGFKVVKKDWPVVDGRIYPMVYAFYVDEDKVKLSEKDLEKSKEIDEINKRSLEAKKMSTKRRKDFFTSEESRLN